MNRWILMNNLKRDQIYLKGDELCIIFFEHPSTVNRKRLTVHGGSKWLHFHPINPELSIKIKGCVY